MDIICQEDEVWNCQCSRAPNDSVSFDYTWFKSLLNEATTESGSYHTSTPFRHISSYCN